MDFTKFGTITMTPEERESEINRECAEVQARAPKLWVKTLGYFSRQTADGFALAGPTCWFFRTDGIPWAMDPAYRPPEGDGKCVYDRIADAFLNASANSLFDTSICKIPSLWLGLVYEPNSAA